jgi:RNA polymerase sigma-70 factor (ECF subfamily)
MQLRRTDTVYPNEDVASRPASLEVMYEDYRDRLMRFVIPRVGGDQHAAEDIVQEAFAAALVSLSGFGARSSPYTWLCAIAQHKIADHYRKQLPPSGTSVETTDPDACVGIDDTGGGNSSVERWFESVETRHMVRDALHELPPQYGEVLRLKYFDGLSAAEIGCAIGRTSKAVEGLLARARQALSRDLSRQLHS